MVLKFETFVSRGDDLIHVASVHFPKPAVHRIRHMSMDLVFAITFAEHVILAGCWVGKIKPKRS